METVVSSIFQNAHIATGTVIERFLSKPRTITHKIDFSRKLAEVLGVYACFGKMIETRKNENQKLYKVWMRIDWVWKN
jgi:hypothetical protein